MIIFILPMSVSILLLVGEYNALEYPVNYYYWVVMGDMGFC